MTGVIEALNEALTHHQAGRIAQAEALYRGILSQDPQNIDALHLLGMAVAQGGDPAAGAELIERAVRLNPAIPAFHNNLGTVYQAAGRQDDAIQEFDRAVRMQPLYPEAHINLANALQALKRYDRAIRHYREALRLAPDTPEGHNNLGNALAATGQVPEAIACYYEAVRLRPAYADAWVNLAGVLKDQNRFEEAVACCRQALDVKPNLAEAYSNLAAILLKQEKYDDAEAAAKRAIELKPDLAEAHANLGVVRMEQERYEESEACARKALELKPSLAEGHSNLGDVFSRWERPEEAVAEYQKALEMKPNNADLENKLGFGLQRLGNFRAALQRFDEAVRLNPALAEAHINRAMAWLQAGDFERGWNEYEWRWKGKEFSKRTFPRPRWDGTPIPERTLLIHAEQGLGDTLQFCRYLPMVKAASQARVVFECQARLIPLLQGLEGVDQFAAAGEPLPAYDFQAPLLSLPGLFGTRAFSVPASPYLRAPEELVAQQKERIGAEDKFKIGIAWSGNPRHKRDRARSIPLALFEALAHSPHVALFSLQRGEGVEQLATAGFEVVDLERDAEGVMDTAASILNLDLVITIDSMIGHLAATLGKPVWILLELAPDWRWLLETNHSAWYPTARLFRQRKRGDWAEVIERLENQVHLETAQHLLVRGRFEEGWKEFEWRWKAGGVSPEQFPQPLWDGSPLEGRRLLLWAEQGLGDTIQYLRYAAIAERTGGKVFVECQPGLAELAATASGVAQAIPFGQPLPEFDVHLPFNSAPGAMRTTLETIPAETPYLSVPPDRLAHWRERLGAPADFRVGLAWAGNPNQANDRNRSMFGAHFGALASVPGCSFYSLQYGPRAGELDASVAAPLAGDFRDVADTAAVVSQLDLVISVDSMAAHLAGALGRPVWTLLCYAADYRWLLDREDSPWYPGMRLFRQRRPGDWTELIQRVAEALRRAARG